MVAGSFLLLLRQRFSWSFLLLGIAVLAKGYPLMLFPVWLLYWMNATGRSSASAILSLPAVLVISPTLVAVVVLSLVVGFEQTLHAYVWQASRLIHHGSFLALYAEHLSTVMSPPVYAVLMYVLVRVLQLTQLFLPLLLFAVQRFFRPFIKTATDVVAWSLLVLLLFIQFFPYHSPQWFIWLFPWLPLFVRQRSELWLVLGIGVVGYLEFPLAFNDFGSDSLTHAAVVLLRTVLYAGLTVLIVRRVIDASGRSRATMTADHQLATAS
jgi:hypothetical protein